MSASQLDNKLDTTSLMLQWLPTTGEFGLYGTFGDYDHHETVATRIGAHYTTQHRGQAEPAGHGERSRTARSGSPTAASSSRRTSSAPASRSKQVDYEMSSLDAGIKYRGFALEAEYYWRWLSDYQGTNTAGIADIDDHGYQVQLSAMVVPKKLQLYAGAVGDRGRLRRRLRAARGRELVSASRPAASG